MTKSRISRALSLTDAPSLRRPPVAGRDTGPGATLAATLAGGFLGGLGLVLLPAAALAQDAAATDLGDILVSGGLTGIAADNYTRDYSSVTADQMAARGITTLEGALRALPGVSVTSSGETYTNVHLRGGESNHTLVLIDGVVANNTTNGEFSFSGLPVADIARIEVLRGPQSALYGTSAMAGVIAITTKRAEGPGLSYGGGFELGGNDSMRLNTYARQGFAGGQISASVERKTSDGEDGSRSGGDTEFNDVDTISVNGDYTIAPGVRAGLSFRHVDQRYGYDANDPLANDPADYVIDSDERTHRQQTIAAAWLEAEAMGGRLLNRFDLSATRENSAYQSPSFGDSDYGSARQGFNYTGSFALDGTDARSAAQKLNVLLQATRETFEVDSAWSAGKQSRNTRGIALDYQGHFAGGIDIQAGLRRDVIDVFEDPTSWNLSAAWQAPGSGLRLRGAVGRATVYPTMYEQFGYAPGRFTGNPDLKPETALSYELGADYDFGGQGSVGVTLFRAEVEDLIASAGATAYNIAGTSERQGVELSGDWQANDWLHLAASYTYTDAHSATGARLDRRPMHELGLQAQAEVLQGRGHVGADLRYVAGSYSTEFFGANYGAVTKLPDFTTVNLTASYDLSENIALNARVVNLFDEDYSETWGYYGQSRTAYLGLSAKW